MVRTSSTPTTRWVRRCLAPFSALALVLALVIVTAGPAAAASEADFVGMGDHTTVYGRVGDSGPWRSYMAGEMLLAIDGGETVVGYCIDIQTSISAATGTGLPEVPWGLSGIANLDQVSYVLNTYVPGSSLLSGTADEKAASIQAAIWHLTDDFNLRTNDSNAAAVIANYNAILAAIPAEGLPVEPAPSLAITPAALTAYVGSAAGPFTVDTTGTELPLTIPAGVQVVDWASRLPITSVSDGDVFGIVGTTVGSVEVPATATATIHAGRVFAHLDPSGDPVVQRLILAQTSEATTSASVTATFEEEEVTTTTTEPESTTTTAAPTTSTTETDVLGNVVDSELPRTGDSTGWLAVTGIAVISLGVLALAGQKRWAVAHHAS